jgi:acyl-[acyl-carrier-protein] desaturase
LAKGAVNLILKDSVYREKLYRAYLDFFKSAETKRRWNVFDDVPWDRLDPSRASEQTLQGVEHACAEELYLPDYGSKVMHLLRSSFGEAWFWANWCYEESKHGLALREYMVRSGYRSSEGMAEFEDVLSSVQWELPFTKVRQMTCYGALQEAATYLGYKILRDRVIAADDQLLEAIFSFIGRDEAAHAGFYRTLMAIDMEQDREGTMADMAFVIPRFKMPGDGLIPGYSERLVASGLAHDTRWYVEKVVMPTLKSAGTSWEELRAHSRKRLSDRTVARA